MMQFWIKVASALPYTDDVGRSVITTLLNIASSDLSPHMPMVAWDWLNKRPALGLESFRPQTIGFTVHAVRQLRDVKLVVSYLCTVWSEWHQLSYHDRPAMCSLIEEEMGGIGATGHRTDLIRRLDYVLLQLGQRRGALREEYEELRKELLKVDEEAMRILAGTLSSRLSFIYSADSYVHVQDVILPLCAHFLFHVHSCVYHPMLLPVFAWEFLSCPQVQFPRTIANCISCTASSISFILPRPNPSVIFGCQLEEHKHRII